MNNLKQVLTLQNNHLIKVCIILYINMLNQMNAKGKGSLTTRNDKEKIDVSSEGPSSGVSSGGVGENHTLNVNLNVINAHLSLSYTLPIDSPLILFFHPILSCVSLAGILLSNTIYTSLFTLCFDEIHLIGFYFVT